MRKAKRIELLDARTEIVLHDEDTDPFRFTQPNIKIYGWDLVKLGRLLGLDINDLIVIAEHKSPKGIKVERARDFEFEVHYGDSEEWKYDNIEAEIIDNTLQFKVCEKDWSAEYSYNGAFAVHWADKE